MACIWEQSLAEAVPVVAKSPGQLSAAEAADVETVVGAVVAVLVVLEP